MNKINLYINGKTLDIYSQDIEWAWENIRFSDGIKDQYSTDISLPKTNNNMNILEVSGLLDSPTQLYGTQLTPSTLEINGQMMDVYVEVAGITEDEISICLYQRTLPDKVFGKKLRDFVHDDYNSIWVWSVNTLTAYPQAFPTYNYGSAYMPKLAMKHPTRRLNDVINDINNTLQDFTLPAVDNALMLMGAQKYVCPQNTRQVIQFSSTGNDNWMVMAGGQHITNDLDGWDGNSKVGENTTNEITFNRDCTATIHGYVSWGRKFTAADINTIMVSLMRNGHFEYGWQINISGAERRNGLVQSTITMNLHAGDTLSLHIGSATTSNPYNKFELLGGVLDIEYSDYEITDNDYDTELVYCHRHPTLWQWAPHDEYVPHYFDGRTEDFEIYNNIGTLNQNDTFSMEFPWRGISYIGYYCNIGDITLKELYFGICWLYQQKPKREMNTMQLISADETITLEKATITEIKPSSDQLGQNTNVSWSDGEHPTTLTTINSVWLEENVKRHESPFMYVDKVAGGLARVRQYTITSSYNEDGETVWDVDYEEPKGAVLLTYGQYGRLQHWGLLPPPNIHNMGINKLKTCAYVTITCFDKEVADKDYVYYNGRKFMVVGGNADLNNGTTTITALLVTGINPVIHEFLP